VDELRYRNVSFLSDYGRTDEFVGVVHAVIHQLCPGVRVFDVTHDVPPFDVRAGGLTLARSVQYLPPGVVVAVVDPGVGTARRLLAPAVAMVGGATRAVALTDSSHHLDAPGPLFDGRDVFAPVAARLCAGVPLEDLGELVDPAGLVPGLMPVARPEPDGTIAAEVLWVDRFGNVQLNLGPDDLPGGEEHLELRLGDRRFSARRAVTFADVGAGALGLVVDSYGMLAVVSDRSSAAEELGVAAGDEVVVAALEGDGPQVAVTTTVRLRGSATVADAPTGTED
jgi:S-adenosylmethionine hydrolase